MAVLQIAFFLLSLILSIFFFLYGFNHYYLLNAGRRYKSPPPLEFHDNLPSVAVHLPIFNEKYVIHRLVAACVQMAEFYDKTKVRLMILDDSNDDTIQEEDKAAAEFSKQGFQIEILRRPNRQGFKAGALQVALEQTPEDFIAIFDADFLPPADFLNRTIPYFIHDESLGIIQGRWSHINRGHNAITRAAAIAIDIHFMVEQTGRYAAGLFQNFNGSAGVLRKKAIREAGGWEADTLAEDLDLSYRMQLIGYKVLYLRDLECPGEIPPTIQSFKQQQGRWACGSLQAAKKILPRLLRKPEIKGEKRLQAFIHMTGYLLHPMMTFSFVLTTLATLLNLNGKVEIQANISAFSIGLPASTVSRAINSAQRVTWIVLLPLIVLCTIAPWVSSISTLRSEKRPFFHNLADLLVLLLLGIGISLNNTLEAGRAIFTKRVWEYARTPKYANLKDRAPWKTSIYQIAIKPISILELAFACIGTFAAALAIWRGDFFAPLILIPFSASYFFVSLPVILQSRPREN